MLTALAFVPEGDVPEAFDLIAQDMPSDMDEFAEYFERNWVGGPAQPPRFPIPLWNQYDAIQARLPRTTNLVEGWHNGFKVLCVTVSQQTETLTDIKHTKINMREQPPKRSRRWISLEERQTAFVDTYDFDDVMSYVRHFNFLK